MAVNRSYRGDGHRFLGHIGRRESCWLWLYMVENGMTLDANQFADPAARINHLGTQLLESFPADPERYKSELLSEMESQLLPAEDLNWIKDLPRLLRWLEWRLPSSGLYLKDPSIFPPQLTQRERLIAQIDQASTMSLSIKKNIVSGLRGEWAELLGDRAWKNWLSTDSLNKSRAAWEWLGRRHMIPSHLHPTQDRDIPDYILSIFDQSLYSPNEKAYFLEKVKRSWSQKKYQEKQEEKGKKQCNFNLSEDTSEKIGDLSTALGVSRSELIRQLVEKELNAREQPSRPREVKQN